ncbi:hypothetical protein BGZ89_006467 [Linnemannia elongata]|nr:hypothetical protein BGZ89_006467 [Linnemannia elongata]
MPAGIIQVPILHPENLEFVNYTVSALLADARTRYKNSKLPALNMYMREQLFFISMGHLKFSKRRPEVFVNYIHTDPHIATHGASTVLP